MTGLTINPEMLKDFMNKLLRENIFDNFTVRSAAIHSFVFFEIDGIFTDLNLKNEVDSDKRAEKKYCDWSILKPYVFNIIKGSALPKHIKIVLSLDDKTMAELDEEAKAMFLNIVYDNGSLTVITGWQSKVFTLDKGRDIVWDNYVKTFLADNNLSFKEWDLE